MTLRPRAGNRWIRDHLTEVTSSCPSSSCSISTWAPCRLVRLREKSSSLPGIFAAITGVLCTWHSSWPGRVIHQRDYWTSRRSTLNCFTPGLGPNSGVILYVDSTAVILTCSKVFTLVPAAWRNTTRVSVPVLAGPFATSRR